MYSIVLRNSIYSIMYRFFSVSAFLFLFTASLFAQSTDSPAGRWQTIDDETGEVKSIINIYEKDGKFYGRVAEILTDNKDAICENCKGSQKNAPIKGLLIMRDLEAEDDYWAGGKILDPEKGSEYRLSIWYENDDPNTLFVRGKHWTGLYRTQQWKRAK